MLSRINEKARIPVIFKSIGDIAGFAFFGEKSALSERNLHYGSVHRQTAIQYQFYQKHNDYLIPLKYILNHT